MKTVPVHLMSNGLSRSAQLSHYLLGLSLAGSALAVGTVHTITLCIVVAVLAAATALAWWGGEPMSPRSAATLLLLAGVGLTAFTVLQCVPMPLRWLAVLAPHNADVWSRALAPLHELGPKWAPMTLDPIATRVEVLKGIAYLLAFVTALRIARQREGARFLSGAIVLTGLALAAAALLHPAFGAHKLFGLYEPGPGIAERHIAPLMNPNNLAGYLNVALCLALAAMLAPEPVVPRPIAGAVALLLGATQLWVGSRGGVVAMGLGVLVVIAIARIARLQTRPREAITTLSLVTGLVTAVGAVLIVIGGSDEVSSELLDTNISKLTLFAHVMRMLPAVPVFGCGRGAFESAFPAFRIDVGHVTYAYPENVVAQWILEWGLPVGLGALATIAFALRPGTMLARSATATGAWAAVVTLAVQNLGDLGSEIPAVALAAVVCAAIVVAGTPGHRPRWSAERWARTPRMVAVVGTGAATAGIMAVATGVGHGLHEDRRSLYHAVVDQRASARTMHGLEREAMLRHPAEPYLPFIAALRASHARDESAIPWIGATLERASVYGPAHLELARTVVTRSPSQARMEYRLAIEQAPEFDVAVTSEAQRVVGSFDDAMELVAGGKEGPRVLEMLIGGLADRLPATRVRLDAELAARAPAKPGPAIRAARDAVEDVEAGEGAPWCEGQARATCVRDALDDAGRARQKGPEQCQPYALRARVRIAEGETTGALTELEGALDSVTDRVTCLQTLEEIARAAGDGERARKALDRIAKSGCRDDTECARTLSWVAWRQEATGNPSTALTLYQRAYERAPEDDALLENIARLAAHGGLHVQAADDYDRLAGRQPADPRWPKAAREQRQAAVKEALKL